jgi:hypothetical protein
VRGNEIHGNEPLLERQFGVLKDSAFKTREIALALVAAKFAILASGAMVLSTKRANHVITPTCFNKSILANVFVIEVVDD